MWLNGYSLQDFLCFVLFVVLLLCLVDPGPEVIKLFSCMKFFLLINMKMPSIIGIFIFISREIFMPRYVYSKKEIAIVSNLRFISKTIFMLS